MDAVHDKLVGVPFVGFRQLWLPWAQLRRFGVHWGGLVKHKGGLGKVRWIRLGRGTLDWTEVPWRWLERVGMLRYLKHGGFGQYGLR